MSSLRVLFLCTGNSARSIIGAALLRALGEEKFEVCSAGIAPRGIDPYTIRVLTEVGIDLKDERSKHVDEFAGQVFDYVITVCDEAPRNCPVFPGPATRLHWSVADPAAFEGDDSSKLAVFRETLRDLQARVLEFIRRKQREERE
jgi:arsenate reductase (thioredoxin)